MGNEIISGGSTGLESQQTTFSQNATIDGVEYVHAGSINGTNMGWTNKATGEKVPFESDIWNQLNPVTIGGIKYQKSNAKGAWINTATGKPVPPDTAVFKLLTTTPSVNYRKLENVDPNTSFNLDLDSDSLQSFSDIHFTALNFSTTPNHLFQQSSSHPFLSFPNEGNMPTTLPYGQAEQKLVKDFFFNEVGVLLVNQMNTNGLAESDVDTIFEALVMGEPLTDPALQKIAESIVNQATAKTITECNLPTTWTIRATKADDWTPIPQKPYGAEKQKEINDSYDATLNAKVKAYIEQNSYLIGPESKEAKSLLEAAAGGKVSSDIVETFLELSAEAKVETQAKFGLSSSWFRGVETPDTWIPINVGAITPAKVNNARLETLIGNLDQMSTDLEAAAKKMLDGMPEGPNKAALTEFLKIIGDAIKDLKNTLRSLQNADAEKSKKETEGKLAALGDKRARMEEQSKKVEESMKKTLETKAQGHSMKIVGPLIAAFMTLLGALIAIATLGIATSASVIIIAAGVAVGIALTLYSMLDSITDCSAKIGKAINESIEKTMKNAPAWAKSLVKALLIIAIIAILVVMLVATGGGASGATVSAAEGVAAQTTTQIVKQLVQEIIKQLSIQMMVMVLMSSNVVPELVGNILKAAGVPDNVVQAIQMVVMAVMMLVCIVAMNKAMSSVGKSAKSVETAAKIAKEAPTALSLGDRAKVAVSNMVAQASKYGNDMRAVLEQVKDMPAKAMKAAMEAIEAGEEMAKNMGKSMEAIFTKMLTKLDKGVIEGGADVVRAGGGSVNKTAVTVKDMSNMEKIMMFSQMFGELPGIVGGAIQGSMLLRVAQIMKDSGEIDAAIQLLEGMIKALEGLLSNLQGGMSTRDDFILQLQELFTKLYDSASNTYGKVSTASLGA
ncbi:MAG: type III secretion system translocon subunit SctE [Candidatus Protochlamydia sp.]|nr:type III secretion system translocon subunit SctE [Candidatus Protochlamydia sp.]